MGDSGISILERSSRDSRCTAKIEKIALDPENPYLAGQEHRGSQMPEWVFGGEVGE